MPVALIVDNDSETTLLLSEILREHGFIPETAETIPKAKEALLHHVPEVAILNDSVDGIDTLSLLESVALAPRTEIYLMSNAPTSHIASRAIRVGASDFFRKPINRDRLAENLRGLSGDPAAEESQHGGGKALRELLVGESRAMQRLYRLIRKAAPGESSIFLAGESGTGKELAARAIHRLSGRSHRDFVSLNCSALAPELLESELFGHKKGGVNGAIRDHRGYFQRAAGGTLFLDEITEMNAGLQSKLLRVLESREIRPLGGEKAIAVDARIISAANLNPDEAIGRGRLREDLYDRLAQFPIRVPALREREGDVLLLAEHFLSACNADTEHKKWFGPVAREALMQYDWPGNIAELKGAVLHSHLLADNEIRLEDLPGRVTAQSPGDSDYVRLNVGTSLAEIERRAILSTLEHYEGDKRRTANVLGISLKTLYNRLKHYKHSG